MYRIQLRAVPRYVRQLALPARNVCSKNVPVSKRRAFVEDDDFYWPARMLNQQMKYMDRMFDDFMPSRFQRMFARPWIREYAIRPENEVKVEYDNTKFEIKLDISDYNAEDLNVKIAGDRLVVSGKHQEKQDKYGSISREFTRQFVIPENVDAESIESSYDGAELVLRGKVKGSENIKERTINIKHQPKEQPEQPKKET